MNYKHTKRLVDVAGAIIGVVVTSPAILYTAAKLYRENKGEVIFTQERVGKDGQPFNILKFKTMTDERDESGKLLPDEARVTSFGKIIRKHSIDELLQFINILKGDMSLVGPRPLMPYTLEKAHHAHIEWVDKYLEQRRSIRPGLICHYDVAPDKTKTWDKQLSSDAHYSKNPNFMTDMTLIVKAVKVAIKSRPDTNNVVHENSRLAAYLDNVVNDNPYYVAPDSPELPPQLT